MESQKRRKTARQGRTGPPSSRRVLLSAVGAAIMALFGYLLLTSTDEPAVNVPVAPPANERYGTDVGQPASGEIVFSGKDGTRRAVVTVEIARDEKSRELGLMYRRVLARNHGMLFQFDSSTVQSFWMKNTYLPLDMIFVDEWGTIVTIHKNTRPLTENSYTSTKPALCVVEVNAGFAEANGLRVGDRMEWKGH